MSGVLQGKDVYTKSTPTEVANFLHFLERKGPFHVVVDALNLYYRSAMKQAPKVGRDSVS